MSALAQLDDAGDGHDGAALWAALRGGGGQEARERLVALHLEFARIMAGRLFARRTYAGLEFDDYLQFAREGLLGAIDRYDATRDAGFRTFAAPRINGAILSGIQSYSDMQEQIATRKRVVAERVRELREEAPEGRDANALFSHLAELAVGLAVGFVLDQSGMYRAEEAGYADNTYAAVEMRQLRERVRAMLVELPERQRQILSYHYLQQQSFGEIAALLALSKARISQLHKEALTALRESLRGGGVDYSF
ncbi:sigma-70 family RNA polymerase sigma factor [Pseudoduganella namucuonensis]|uniref:RNA polymerase sigma factor for flagellar operon FliA n=1 Tax=Pseudoduganella namucuonensis TaxID=1035707 RepID=A0A1I7M3W0_9BURK|nr:sigma-70 family RNA polymerase sigma factor [Pseudoduganella namucuonensis]SFV16632.1 RNA polymerase sigma factor for flagellar operon FliA [Pseudoduganella namucuonensis]